MSAVFTSVREYSPGDAIGRIHWPSTFRHGGLMIKEFEREVPSRVYLLLDWDEANLTWGKRDDALERLAQAALSWAHACARGGLPLTAVIAQEEGVALWRVESGLASFASFQLWIAKRQKPVSAPFEHVCGAVEGHVQRGDLLIALLADLDGKLDAKCARLERFVRRGAKPIALIVDRTCEDARVEGASGIATIRVGNPSQIENGLTRLNVRDPRAGRES